MFFANVLGLFACPSYFVNILKHVIPEDADGGGMLLMSELPLGLEHGERDTMLREHRQLHIWF